jgi:hypothetical protein
VEGGRRYVGIELEFDGFEPAGKFGPEYLTYVLWAISPEGRSTKLGEILLNGTQSQLSVTTELQAFGLIVTAEPYFAVSQPCELVVMENVARHGIDSRLEEIETTYELLQKGEYTLNVDPHQLQPMDIEVGTPLELFEARNAVRIARWAGADRYAIDPFQRAEKFLLQAEEYHSKGRKARAAALVAREAARSAEQARSTARLTKARSANP